jgi:cyanate permease
MFFFTNMAFSSMPVFLPTIIHEMGHTALASQALSAPPYLMSFVIVIATAWFSDRLRNRSFFIIFHALLSATGYTTIAVAGHFNLSPWVRYSAIYPAAVGFFSVITIIITVSNHFLSWLCVGRYVSGVQIESFIGSGIGDLKHVRSTNFSAHCTFAKHDKANSVFL